MVDGAALIAAMVAAFIDSGMGVGPLSWDGQAGEKWSFTLLHNGHINQWDALFPFGFDECKNFVLAVGGLIAPWINFELSVNGEDEDAGWFIALHRFLASDKNAAYNCNTYV